MADSQEISAPLNQASHLHGLIAVDKPPGPTTYDVIRFLRRTCCLDRKTRMGHLGTLDPFASGVVVVAFGQAVRYAQFALRLDKTYRARLWLGDETDTLDPTGKVVESSPVPSDWKDRLTNIRDRFIGEIEQMPPAFSAKQVDGKRAYNSARRGEAVALKPARITILELEFSDWGDNYVDFTCRVSSGTYIRSLGRDLAKAIGTTGHLVGLERTSVGPFSSEITIPFDAFEIGGRDVLEHHLKPIDMLLVDLPGVVLARGSEMKVVHGKELETSDIDSFPDGSEQIDVVRIMDSDGLFRSLGRMNESTGRIRPFKPWVYDTAQS
jgi:tRNA pseudouridine55 synthase